MRSAGRAFSDPKKRRSKPRTMRREREPAPISSQKRAASGWPGMNSRKRLRATEARERRPCTGGRIRSDWKGVNPAERPKGRRAFVPQEYLRGAGQAGCGKGPLRAEEFHEPGEGDRRGWFPPD